MTKQSSGLAGSTRESRTVKAAKRQPGRPRDERIDDAVVKAAVYELSISGIRNFRIGAVAERAKVAKATIYLRWPQREQLILEAMRSTGRSLHAPETGNLRDDLRGLVAQWADIYADREIARVLARIEAEQLDFPEIVGEYRNTIALPANRIVESVVAEARTRGELREGVSVTVAARVLVGSIRLHAALNSNRITPGFRKQLVEILYHGLVCED